MRITQTMSTLNVVNNIQTNLNKMNKTYQMMSTGRKILLAQDDVSGAVKAMGLRSELAETEQYSRNAKAATSVLEETDSGLSHITTTMNRIRELAVYGANSTHDQTSRDAIGDEINQLIEELVNVGNTQVAGKYIFGGYQTKNPPYSFATGYTDGVTGNESLTAVDGTLRSDINANNVTTVTYGGDNGKMVTEVSPGVTIAYTVPGQQVFSNGDVFKVAMSLRDSLYKNDTQAISNALGDVDDVIDEVLRSRSEVGAVMNRIDRVSDRLVSKKESTTDLLSTTEDVDYAEAVIQLSTQKAIHQASLQVGAKLLEPSLLDYLR